MSNKTITPGGGFELDNPNHSSVNDGPVECLGKTFENDSARREYYLGILAEKLKDTEFRNIEGFPIGDDEAILNLSDPPYYTSCPNPFMGQFIDSYGRPYDPDEQYNREPYAADVSEGKNDPIYNAHSYHTKVPHKAIMRYILHYTSPGDVVFDGFCGTGMTGVAAQLCGNRVAVESLGYKVLPDGQILQELKQEDGGAEWVDFSVLGERKAVLNDLSTAASFIAHNYNTPIVFAELEKTSNRILQEVEEECGWMYDTLHNDGKTIGKVNFIVWTDVFSCPECSAEINFWKDGVDKDAGKVKDVMLCHECASIFKKRSAERVWATKYDDCLEKVISYAKEIPVFINYSVNGKRFEKAPDQQDLDVISKISDGKIPYPYPKNEIPDGFNTAQPKRSHGITHVHHFYTKRNLWVISAVLERLNKVDNKYKAWFTSTMSWVGRELRLHLGNYFGGGGGVITSLRGTLYVASLSVETNVLARLALRVRWQKFRGDNDYDAVCIATGSAASMSLPDSSCDYVFLDPPFGANLNYSELNCLLEAWLGVRTNNIPEAIENKVQKKGLSEYRALMKDSFSEAYRVLKPGRWMTVEFSNTKASVWNNIQTALLEAGFIVANVSALDKKKGSFKACTTPTAVKQDLVISLYKPNGGFENRFQDEPAEEGIWDFVRTHLGYLPVVKKQAGELVRIPERDIRILFDQVVSYFVRSVRDVPVSSKEFQEGLAERFAERDGMVFLPEQIAEYDKARISSSQIKQLSIFVDDEASAIEWLRQLLNEKPQSYQDVHPKFISELGGWKKAEEQLELSTLLEQNFIKYDGIGLLPPQIHSYLSTNFKEFRKLKNNDAQLVKKAKDRWYVPNPEREEDLQKLRERSLLSEFAEYKNHTGKKLKKVRMEAVRCGFKKAWQERDYPTIISVAEKIPQDLLQEDQKLLMWYDQAQTRASDESLF